MNSDKIQLKNIVVNIKGKKVKLTITVPLNKIVEALEQEGYLVFKAFEKNGVEILERIRGGET